MDQPAIPESDVARLDREPVAGAALPAVAVCADGIRRPLPPAHVTVEIIVAWIVTAVCLVVLLVALLCGFLFDWFPTWLDGLLGAVYLVVAPLLCWLAHAWPRWEYHHLGYAVHETGIDIFKGLVWRRVISVPRSRVQHTDVEEGPLQRRHGLASLVIHTAGGEEARVELSSLERGTALGIRDFLIHDAGRERGGDVV